MAQWIQHQYMLRVGRRRQKLSISTISLVALIFQPTLLSTPIKKLLTASVDISSKKQQQTPTTLRYLGILHYLLLFEELETRSPIFSTVKIFERAVKKPLRNTPHPTATNPVQTNQVVQKSSARDDRGGLHADTVGEPSFHVLGWLTSNF